MLTGPRPFWSFHGFALIPDRGPSPVSLGRRQWSSNGHSRYAGKRGSFSLSRYVPFSSQSKCRAMAGLEFEPEFNFGD